MLTPSHLTSVVLFAMFVSVVFGITQRETPRRMLNYGLYCFTLFVGSVFLLSWVMPKTIEANRANSTTAAKWVTPSSRCEDCGRPRRQSRSTGRPPQ